MLNPTFPSWCKRTLMRWRGTSRDRKSCYCVTSGDWFAIKPYSWTQERCNLHLIFCFLYQSSSESDHLAADLEEARAEIVSLKAEINGLINYQVNIISICWNLLLRFPSDLPSHGYKRFGCSLSSQNDLHPLDFSVCTSEITRLLNRWLFL